MTVINIRKMKILLFLILCTILKAILRYKKGSTGYLFSKSYVSIQKKNFCKFIFVHFLR